MAIAPPTSGMPPLIEYLLILVDIGIGFKLSFSDNHNFWQHHNTYTFNVFKFFALQVAVIGLKNYFRKNCKRKYFFFSAKIMVLAVSAKDSTTKTKT